MTAVKVLAAPLITIAALVSFYYMCIGLMWTLGEITIHVAALLGFQIYHEEPLDIMAVGWFTFIGAYGLLIVLLISCGVYFLILAPDDKSVS